MVVRAVAQQAVGHTEPEGSARPGDRARSCPGRRRHRRELPSRRAGKMGAGLRGAAGDQPGDDHGAHLRIRTDRSDARHARVRRNRRVDGRNPLCVRASRPASGAHRHLDRRFDRGPARGHRRTDGAAPSRRDRRPRPRRGADHRCRPVRGRLQHDGEHGAGVRPLRRCARAHRWRVARHRAVEHLRLRRWRDRRRRQRRRNLQASDDGHRPGRPGNGSCTREQRGAGQADRRDRRRNPVVVRRTPDRRSARSAEAGRCTGLAHLQRGRHVRGSPVCRARDDRTEPAARRHGAKNSSRRAQAVSDPRHDALARPVARPAHRRGVAGAWTRR